ncbi:MAG: phenylacetate-CoA oxygenase subunit PaaJ [Planctomycetes bacterium]|nr:phenylacetate-CoA oxygenase subunit PaaJ [Planctomycetota bacterium]
MPIDIVSLGIVVEVRARPAADSPASDIEVDITPTFVGCPALDMLRTQIESRLKSAGAARVRVRFINDPPWSVERISDGGREALRLHGVTVPARGLVRNLPSGLVPLTVSAREPIACPYCGSLSTRMESPFGPTRCRTIHYCDACRNQFEHMKPV